MNWSAFQASLDNWVFFTLLVSTLFYWLSLAFPRGSFLFKFANIAIISSSVLASYILASRWFTYGYFPLSNLYESLIFLTWALTSVSLFLTLQTKTKLLGSVTAPLAMFISAFASLSLPEDMQKASPLVPALKSNWLMMHVSIMMASYATLIVGSLLGILFLVLTKGEDVQLKGNSLGLTNYQELDKSKLVTNFVQSNEASVVLNDLDNTSKGLDNFGTFDRLTLLQGIDNLSYRIIGLGFPLLSLGIIAGAVWANEAWGSYWSWDPKETWAFITWLVFATYLHARITKSWQGRKPAILASIGFFVVWICYLGVNFLGKGLHSYGWVL
uniref:Cytochrome c biogenesis protein CcsA n=1 Tax=Haptophyceae sp. NIES-3900 TaxID=2748608 RepID=A0A7R6WDV6_9EUKA|nr:heme attachment to plastid cytochrome c [Haptophyceae sp. NIES-3900]